jgi:eukaryotic sulfide quinone oxidoreductase
MWMAWDRYRKTRRGGQITIDFFSGMPTMFSVKKYSDALEALRVRRGVGGHFGRNLVSIDAANRKAVFKNVADGTESKEDYTLLHVTPPMGPLEVLKGSPIVDAAGWVEVDKGTLQHVKPEYGNIFALGDASSLPTSKTGAAITKQAPVLTENLFHLLDSGKIGSAVYDGYTSCPVRSFVCKLCKLGPDLSAIASDGLWRTLTRRVQVWSCAGRVVCKFCRGSSNPAKVRTISSLTNESHSILNNGS